MIRLAVLFAVMSAAVAGMAAAHRDWAWVLVWPALNLAGLAAAYAGLGPRVLGKGPQGQINPWASLFFLPFRLYVLGIWHVVRRFGRERPFVFLGQDLILSRRLLAHEIPANVTNWVDLCAEARDPPAARHQTNYIFLPVLDAGFPDPADLNRAIDRLQSGVTLVHCAQGHGRTAIFVLAVLARRGCIRCVDQGLAMIAQVRPAAVLNRYQQRFVRQVIAPMVAANAGTDEGEKP
jgi:hypothetical protein